MHFFRVGVRAGGDGIKARHDLFQDACKSLRRFKGGRILRCQIQHVASPQEIAERVLVPGQQGFQLLTAGSGCPFGQQGLVDIGDVIAVDQGVPQAGGSPLRRGNLGIRAEAELFNQGVHQGRIIGGNDGQGVSGNVHHSGAVQAVFNMDRFFRAAFPGEVLDGKDGCGERILFAVRFGCHV